MGGMGGLGSMGGMSVPVGMQRRALSYDDNMEAPMELPPSDISINNLWRRPVIPDRKFTRLAEVHTHTHTHTHTQTYTYMHSLCEDEEGGSALTHRATFTPSPSNSPAVVKTKASSIIMSSLMTKQTQDSMFKFEQKAGLSDTSYTPHKGLTAEETRYHQRMPESFHKLQIQNVEVKEEKHPSSAQSTPSSTPQSSPKQKRRSWFSSTGSELSVSSSSSSIDMGGGAAGAGEGAGGGGGGAGGGAVDRWGPFGPRPSVQKTTSDLGSEPTPAGFALQSYRGAQKPTPMEVMKAQGTRLADNVANQAAAPPKMEIPSVDGRRPGTRPHKLKHRDMNILTPSGF
ncbi:putative monooxygenase p33MONOX [Aplochiton taeniatus]